MTDLPSLIAAVERIIELVRCAAKDARSKYPAAAAESERDAALLSELAEALKGARTGWQDAYAAVWIDSTPKTEEQLRTYRLREYRPVLILTLGEKS